jgi:hypothetical protein
LSAWGTSLVYDTTKFSYNSISYPLYTTVLTSTAVPNALNITGSGGSVAVTGWFLAATLSFTIISAAAGTTVSISMPAIMTNAMTNSVPITYKNNFVGYFADSRGGWSFLSGQLAVLNPVVAGVYAYSTTRSTFVNTFALNSVVSVDTMIVRASYGTGRGYASYADDSVIPSSCVSANSAVITSSPIGNGCSNQLAQTGGSSSVGVTASYSGFSATVSYRAFFFVGFSLNATRSQLRRLGCDFETTYLSAYGQVTVDGVTVLSTIDISNSVTFVSSNPSVLSVSGRLARGLAVGTATLSYGGGIASMSISVSNTVASLSQLISYVYSSTSVSPTSSTQTELQAASLLVQPTLSLTAELQVLPCVRFSTPVFPSSPFLHCLDDFFSLSLIIGPFHTQTAAVVTYALHDDGVWSDYSRYPTLTLSSTSAGDLNVTRVGQDWQVIVPVGASTITGATPIITSKVTDSCATVLSTAGYGYAKTNLSTPIAIVVTAAAASLARPSTPAATTLGIATSTQLTVTVTFRTASGSITNQVFTTDSRTVYNPSYVNCAGSLSSDGSLSLTSNSGAGTAGTVTISVSMPSYAAAAGLSGSITVPVVDVNTAIPLSGSLVHAVTPTVPVTSSFPLAQFACTGAYSIFTHIIYLFIIFFINYRSVSDGPVKLSGSDAHRWQQSLRNALFELEQHCSCNSERHYYNPSF